MDKNVKGNVTNMVKDVDGKKLTIDDKITIKELEERIESMKADKERKCKSAKEQLISMLEVTVDKYRTATGTAEALRILRFIGGDALQPSDIFLANMLAGDLAFEADHMKKKAEELTYAEMDKICDGFYDKEFSLGNGSPIESDEDIVKAVTELAFEMMRIDLCRNVGGAAEDMVAFVKRTEEEIDACGKKLKELKAKGEDKKLEHEED